MKEDVLFIWIPKNAGTSLWKSNHKLFNKISSDNIRKNIESLGLHNSGWLTTGHLGMSEVIKYLDKDFYERAYKFAIVRNPFRRMISIHSHVSAGTPFEQFCLDVQFQIREREAGRLSKVKWPSLKNQTAWSHANRQYDYIYDKDGKLIVDRVLRLENIDEDIRKLSKIIGYDLKFGRENVKTRKPLSEYYKTKESIEAVRNTYRIDFDSFGYSDEYGEHES